MQDLPFRRCEQQQQQLVLLTWVNGSRRSVCFIFGPKIGFCSTPAPSLWPGRTMMKMTPVVVVVVVHCGVGGLSCFVFQACYLARSSLRVKEKEKKKRRRHLRQRRVCLVGRRRVAMLIVNYDVVVVVGRRRVRVSVVEQPLSTPLLPTCRPTNAYCIVSWVHIEKNKKVTRSNIYCRQQDTGARDSKGFSCVTLLVSTEEFATNPKLCKSWFGLRPFFLRS
jgi:hypothetical protein